MDTSTDAEAAEPPGPQPPPDGASEPEPRPPGMKRSVKRLVIALGVAALVCIPLGWLGAPDLTGPTDIVGYPTYANFNLEPAFWRYRVIVYAFPLFTIVAYLLLARFGPLRSSGSRPARRTIELVDPEPIAPPTPVDDGWSLGAVVRIVLPAAVVVAASGARTGHADLLALAAGVVYVAVVLVAAELWARRSGGQRWPAMSTINGVGGAVVAVLGIWFVSAHTVVQTPTGTRSWPWLAWWLPVLGVVAIVWWATRQLRSGRAANDVELTLLTVVVGATAVFLMMSTLPGQLTFFQGFDDALEMAGASVFDRGYFPWRDVLFVHGVWQDVLIGSFARSIVGDTIWAISAFHSLILLPLMWVSSYLFAVWVCRRNAWFLASTFGVVCLLKSILELALPLQDDHLPMALLAASERLVCVPVTLILLGETLRRRSAGWAVALTLLVVVQEILVPETLFVAGPVLVCVVAAELVHRRPGQNLWATLRLTRWCVATGLVALAVWAAYLASFGALRAFIDYYIVLGPGHNLTGAIPPTWVGPAEWAMLTLDVVCVLLTIWSVAVKVARRADWQPLDWVTVAAAVYVALYLEKPLGRLDAAHVWQAYGASLPLVLLWCWRLFVRQSPRVSARWSRRRFKPSGLGQPVIAVLVLAIAVGLVYAGPVRKASGQHHLSGVTEASYARLGYAAPGSIDTDLLRDLDASIRAYAGDDGSVFDMTNSLGYLYFVLGRKPGTRFIHVSMAVPEYSQRLLIGELKAAQPPVVVYDADSIGMPIWDGITNELRHYDVSEYVLRGWTPVLRTHGVLVMARNDLARSRPMPVLTTPQQTTDLYFSGPSCDWGAIPNYLRVPDSDRATTLPVHPAAARTVVYYAGWAVDPATNRPAGKVLIADGDRVVGTATPSIIRPDVAQALHQPNSASGFQYMGAFDTEVHPSAYVLGGDGLAHPLNGSPAGPGTELRMPDGSQVKVAPAAVGNLEVKRSEVYSVGEFQLPPGSTLRDYDLVKLSSTGGLGGARVAVTDQPGRLFRDVSAIWLDKAGRDLTLRVGSCPQWYGFDPSRPLFVMQSGGSLVTSVTLSARRN